MRFAKTSHGKIFYTVKGEGMPVVLIRGLGRWSAHWCGWDDALAKHCKVITFDNKGLGLTTSPMRPWHTLSDIANDVAVVLRQERIDSAHIVGTSLGGMVSLVFALRHPELTKSISVIAASVGRSGHPRISASAARILIRAPLLRDGIYDELAGLLTSPKTSQEVRQKLARQWRQEDAKHKQPIVTVISQLIAVLRFRKWEDLAKIKSAAQIIVGKDDLFVPRGNSLFLHSQMPTSQLIELECAGHEPHVDQPEVMTKLIVNFIKHHNHPPSH